MGSLKWAKRIKRAKIYPVASEILIVGDGQAYIGRIVNNWQARMCGIDMMQHN